MSDASKTRNMTQFSQRFVSYFEKHRIFELFQELSMMLLIKEPDDHVLFLKQSLYNAARRLDAPRLIILAPPEFDKSQLATELTKKLIIPIITLNDIAGEDRFMSLANPQRMIHYLRAILMNYLRNNFDGWIFLDFPRNEKEARRLQRNGIIPSHVIDIILPDTISNSSRSNEDLPKNEYQKEIRGLRHVFSKLITTINIKDKKMQEIAEVCLNIIKRRKLSGPPTIFRVLLVDSIDSNRSKCLGQLLAHEYSITHIDFNEALERIAMQETDLGDAIRAARQKGKYYTLPMELKIQAFEQTLHHSEGLKKGWILTGFVNNLKDFKQLDMTDTPPNRVIIIVPNSYVENKGDDSECRSFSAFINLCPSEKTNNDPIDEYTCIGEQDVKDIINYTGESGRVIKNHEDVKLLKDKIDLYMMLPPPCVPPRIPGPPPEIKPEDIEYDPDDEPCTELLACIREPEPELPLV